MSEDLLSGVEAPAEAPTEAPAEEVTAEEVEAEAPKLAPYDPTEVPDKFFNKETGELNIQDLVKSNAELEKTLHARAPETYEFEDVFTEHNLAFENDEQETEITDLFKKHRLSQDAVNDILTVYGSRQNMMIEQMGPEVDLKAEHASLEKAWGNQTEQRLTEVKEYFAKNELPPELYTQPLVKSAAGLDMLYTMMKNTQGPSIVKDTVVPVEDLKSDLNSVISNPAYSNARHPDHRKLQEQATIISSKISAQR